MRIFGHNCRRLAVIAATTLLLGACASFPANQKITELNPNEGYRFNALPKGKNTDSLFVMVTLSGGGTRAAALSYGVLQELANTQIEWKGETKSLLSEVDVISSVSGGSFAAAYYGLFREKIFLPRGDPEGFRDRMLYRNLQRDLAEQLLNPINLARLASPTFGRIDLAAELYNDTIFDRKTFSDLSKRGRPFLMMNATDMSKGAQFSFTQERFDYLCSNLSPFEVGRAVAASSDFPVAFSPLTLVSYANACKYDTPVWITAALKDRAFKNNPRRWNWARITKQYRDPKKHPFVHLLDGGLADNIGLRGPLWAMESNDLPWSIPNKINNDEIEKLVVIVVDAKTQSTPTFDTSPNPPGLISVLSTVAGVPMDHLSFDTVERLSTVFKGWKRDRQHLWKDRHAVFAECPPPPDNRKPGDLRALDSYAIYVGFDQINDESLREKFLAMPTNFHLEKQKVDALIKIGPQIMTNDPMVMAKNESVFPALVKCLNEP